MATKIEVFRKKIPTERNMSSNRILNNLDENVERQLPPERDVPDDMEEGSGVIAAQTKLEKNIPQPQSSSSASNKIIGDMSHANVNITLSNSNRLADEQKFLANQKMMILLENFSDEQFCRYEMYRRSKFSKPTVKKLVKQITGGQNINEKTAIALAGVAKVFVGQLIENALDYQETLNESGPLKPKHIREANRRLQNKSTNFYQ